MNQRTGLLATVVGLAVTYAIMELYMALRPPDLTDQIQEYFTSARGRFEAWSAERERRQHEPPRSPHED